MPDKREEPRGRKVLDVPEGGANPSDKRRLRTQTLSRYESKFQEGLWPTALPTASSNKLTG
jgi:hypothetical protein